MSGAAKKAPKERNPVHELEQLRDAVRREQQTAKAFEETWGFLRGSIAQQFALTKKGSAANMGATGDSPSPGADAAASATAGARDRSTAAPRATVQQLYRTTARSVGTGRSLEIFGVAEHAIRVPKFD